MKARVQVLLKHKGNFKVDILCSDRASTDTAEFIDEATDICKSINEIKDYLANFKKFNKVANNSEVFFEDNNSFGEFENIVLVEDLGDSIFLTSKIKFLDYDKSKKELYKDYTESLIEETLLDENEIKKVANTLNGVLYKLSAKNKVLFLEIDNRHFKEETLNFLLELYLRTSVETLDLVS